MDLIWRSHQDQKQISQRISHSIDKIDFTINISKKKNLMKKMVWKKWLKNNNKFFSFTNLYFLLPTFINTLLSFYFTQLFCYYLFICLRFISAILLYVYSCMFALLFAGKWEFVRRAKDSMSSWSRYVQTKRDNYISLWRH